ncbi:MAG: NUDIX domain-containing protein [Actinobacteria bacterium]|nr:NUDIX domain-containing protein [Actinomycetota bacterium]MCI0678317.1 NUDIX domain-containing protein [Actinomycetota bacterium]
MSGPVRSAGLLPYRLDAGLRVLVAHPGGPYFVRKDVGWWSVIKGETRSNEPDLAAAAREFEEETGWVSPPPPWLSLGETTLRSKKVVVAWAAEHNYDLESFRPGTFRLHGRSYPEIDRVAWLDPITARAWLNPAQAVFIDRLEASLGLNDDRRSRDG